MVDVKAEPSSLVPFSDYGGSSCQCCMKRDVLMSLLETPEGFAVPLYEVFKYVFVIEIRHNGYICSFCLEELYRSYRFKVTIAETQKQFLNTVSQKLECAPAPEKDTHSVDDDDNHFDSVTENPPNEEESKDITMLQTPIKTKIEFEPSAQTDDMYKLKPIQPYEPGPTDVLYKRKAVSPDRILKIPVDLAVQINQVIGGERPKHTHLPFKIDRKTLICSVCKEKHNSYDQLREHIATHFQQFICEECGKGCSTKFNLLQHKRTHMKRDTECQHCGKVFKKYQLQSHIDSVHLKNVTYKCPHCFIVFKTYYLKAKHIQEEHKEEALTYECTICFKKFCTSGAMTGHIRNIHINARKVACDLCDAMFRTRCELKRHYYTHSNERNYQCDRCHKSYKTPHHLSGHIKSHHSHNKG